MLANKQEISKYLSMKILPVNLHVLNLLSHCLPIKQ